MPSRVLLIDDDPSGLLALSEVLARRIDAVLIETALDVHAALDMLREKEYHVIISDVRMDGLDGLALLNQVRERWPEVSVILITAGGRDREADAFRHGAYAFMEKPIDVEQMLATIKNAIERTQLLLGVRNANRHSQLHLDLQASRMDLGFDPTVKKKNSP
jgi:DNA-binding NtrC family response regulator